MEEERLKQLMVVDPHQTSSELAAVLGQLYRTALSYFNVISKVNKLDQWALHHLFDWNRQ